ncbi:MAG: hypothetical protein IAE78_22105 [Myxococcus sp.]|nr:hypothetical protein [Myxococcus sp.]
MPPRSMLAMTQPQQSPAAGFDYSGRKLKLVQAQLAPAREEPSPMMEAIRKYLDSLP